MNKIAYALAFACMYSGLAVGQTNSLDRSAERVEGVVREGLNSPKLIEECGYTVEASLGTTRVTDENGRQFDFVFDGQRLTEYRNPYGSFVVVYDSVSQRPTMVINSQDGKATRIVTGVAPEFLKGAIAKEKLPTVEKLVSRLCAQQSRAKDFFTNYVPDEDYFLLMSEDYWTSTLGQSDMGWWELFDKIPATCERREVCYDGCEDNNIFNLLGCVVITGAFAIFGMPEVGVVAGSMCAIVAQGVIRPGCRARCARDIPCFGL